jgi:hypothetical protein
MKVRRLSERCRTELRGRHVPARKFKILKSPHCHLGNRSLGGLPDGGESALDSQITNRFRIVNSLKIRHRRTPRTSHFVVCRLS